jgi:hypothetical protein
MNAAGARLTPLVLLCLSVFLVLFPLGVGKPGMPLTFKADEPAYFLMALSLARDGDLQLTVEDQRRAVDAFPHLQAQNTVLMTDDGWRTIYFGKPYLYSLFAAPLTDWLGSDGMMTFNMLLLVAMIAMGTSYLSRFNHEGLSALFASGFFIVSSLFSYVFWLHPEVFMATSVCACLYFGFHEPRQQPAGSGLWWRFKSFWRRPAVRLVLSAATLAAGVYHKPMLAVLGLPVLWSLARQRQWKEVGVWMLAAVVASSVFAGFAYVETGHPSAYLGVQRAGFRIDDPEHLPIQPQPIVEKTRTTNSWEWLWRLPQFKPLKTLDAIQSFLWGRHVGLIPYMPFAVLAILLFVINGIRDGTRWLLLASLGALGLFFMIWIPFNWHGGGGFVGNRYFVAAYPAFLFLVTRVRPASALLAAYAFGGALLGVLVFQPLGSPVRHPTLQSHVRGRLWHLFPLEKGLQPQIPGYVGRNVEGAWFRARRDVVELRGTEIWTYGASKTELWMVSEKPIVEPAVFEVRSLAADNEITLSIGDQRASAVFPSDQGPTPDVQLVEIQPVDPELFRPVYIIEDDDPPRYLYTLWVDSRTGRVPRDARGRPTESFYLGAGIRYLGTKTRVYGADSFAIKWLECAAPERVTAGERFAVAARMRNLSHFPWPPTGVTRMTLSYHWLRDGRMELFDGVRTALPDVVKSGDPLETTVTVEAPAEPGTYTLELDPVREHIGWFSERNGGEVCEATVEVQAAQ